MGFDSGSISFQRYAVVGSTYTRQHETLLASITKHLMRPTEIGKPEEVEWGWIGPKHVLDGAIDFESCVFNDCIFVGLRIDTNKVPPALRTAWQHEQEAAVAANNPSGFLSKTQKREIKDTVSRMVDEALRSGQYRRSTMVPILWDVPAGIVYGPSTISAREKLQELFARTFELELHPLTSGHIALRRLEEDGKRRTYEEFVPTRFAKSLEDPDMPAEYPWTAKGDGAKDFLGNEFLAWLWFHTHTTGVVHGASGTITVMFDRSLQMDCVYGQTGKDGLVGTAPVRMAEAIAALRTGKVPRKAGLIVDAAAGQFSLTLTGDSLAVGALKLPEIEKADTARTLFEERITLLRDFSAVLDELFGMFLLTRAGSWSQTVDSIKRWIKDQK